MVYGKYDLRREKGLRKKLRKGRKEKEGKIRVKINR